MRNKNGFTLVELLAVIVILGVIALIAVPSYNNYIKKTKDTKCDSDKEAIIDAAKTCDVEMIYKNGDRIYCKDVNYLLDNNYLNSDYSKYRDNDQNPDSYDKDNDKELNDLFEFDESFECK